MPFTLTRQDLAYANQQALAQHVQDLFTTGGNPPDDTEQPAPPAANQTAPDAQESLSIDDVLNRIGGWAADAQRQSNAPTAAQADSAPDTTPSSNGWPAPSAPVTAPLQAPASTPVTPSSPVTAPLVAPTTAELSGGGSAAKGLPAQSQAILSGAADIASWLGDQGQKALQAVLVTEGGMGGARGDNGKSAGPLQFYEGGQLANYAQQRGLTLEQAKQDVEANPLKAISWAVGTPDNPGYLGGAIARGIQQGLSGAPLATYAQQHGQVSVSPERAGANYNALFGGGAGPVTGGGQVASGSTGGSSPPPVAGSGAPVLSDSEITTGSPTAVAETEPSQSPVDDLRDHVTTLLNGGVTALDQGGSQAIQTLGGAKDQLAQHPYDLSGGAIDVRPGVGQDQAQQASANEALPSSDTGSSAASPGALDLGAQPAPAAVPSLPPPPSSPIDVVKQKFSDALDAFGNLLGGVRGGAQSAADQLGSALPDVTGTLQTQAQSPGLARVASGAPMSAAEQLATVPSVVGGYEQAREQATENLNPLRDVPIVGGAINSATDPLAYVQGAATDAALRAAGHALGPLAGPAAARVTSAIGDAVQGALGDVLPSLGGRTAADVLSSRQPAQATAGLASGADLVAPVAREFQPAALAPRDVQGALNSFDGTIRVGDVQADNLVHQGVLTQQGLAGYRAVTRDAAMTAFTNDIRNSSGAVAKVPGSPRPAGWVDGATLPATTNLEGWWLDPNTARVVQNTVNRGASTPVLTGLGNVVGAGKQVILEGSPFHLVQLELQAARLGREEAPTLVGRSMANAISPSAYDAYAAAQAPWYERAAQAGVTQLSNPLEGEGRDMLSGWTGVGVRGAIGGAGGALQTYLSEKDTADSGTLARDMAIHGALGAGIAGGVGAVIGPALWERAVPTLKVEGFKTLVGRGLGDEAAAAVVNNAFGGQNLVRMARSSQFQDALRAVALAPDWWESIGRNLGTAAQGAVTGGGAMGRAEGASYLGAVAANLALVEGINWLGTGGPNGGHFTWDNGPGHQWDVAAPWLGKTTNDQGQPQTPYIDALGWLKPVISAPSDMGAFARGRASLPLSFALEAVQNKNPATGKDLVAPGTPPWEAAARYLTEVLAREMPAGAGGLQRAYEQGGAGGAAAAGLTGLRVSAQSDAAAARASAAANPAAAAVADPLQSAYRSVGLNIPSTAQSLQIPTSRARIGLSQQEGQQYAAGVRDALQRDMGSRVSDPAFAAQDAKTRVAELRGALTSAEREAAGQFLSTLSDDEITRRAQQRAAATPTPYAGFQAPTSGSKRSQGFAAPTSTSGNSAGSSGISYPYGQPTKTQGTLADGTPDDNVTPGAVMPGLSGDALKQYSASPRTVPTQLKNQVYAAYGIGARQQGDYEVDHRVPRALGGADDLANLWPQPKTTSSGLGYHEKDIVEAYEINQYRAGKVPLEQAQRDAAYNWQAVYKQLPAAQRQRISDQLDSLTQSERDALTN